MIGVMFSPFTRVFASKILRAGVAAVLLASAAQAANISWDSGSICPLNNTLDSGKTLLVTGTVYSSTSPTVGGTFAIAGTGNTTFSGVIADFETTGVTTTARRAIPFTTTLKD